MELIKQPAREIVKRLRRGEISVSDCVDALSARIADVEPSINALPTLCFDRVDQDPDKSTALAGLPVAIKDLNDVAGVRTSNGSMVNADFVPDQSDLTVQTLEANGANIYAKSNTPEFGSGGNTFNDVFGATRNPHDITRSAGGSSGGAAAALASGTAWLAQGSDLAGSLRTPASFCGVTSLRPSPGLIVQSPGLQPFEVYAQQGPMARDIEDLALFADAMTGASSSAGLSKTAGFEQFQDAAARPQKPLKIAFSNDLGICQTSAEVTAVCRKLSELLGQANIPIDYTEPDLSMADLAFDVPRALSYAQSYGAELDQIRDRIKPENVWNIEKGLNLKADEIRASLVAQGQIFQNSSQFMQDYDLLICPASIITAMPVEERYPGFSCGVPYADYYRWLKIAYAVTATTLPVITLPVGKTDAGLPVGIQLIGKAHSDVELFSFARYIEAMIEWDPLQCIA